MNSTLCLSFTFLVVVASVVGAPHKTKSEYVTEGLFVLSLVVREKYPAFEGFKDLPRNARAQSLVEDVYDPRDVFERPAMSAIEAENAKSLISGYKEVYIYPVTPRPKEIIFLTNPIANFFLSPDKKSVVHQRLNCMPAAGGIACDFDPNKPESLKAVLLFLVPENCVVVGSQNTPP